MIHAMIGFLLFGACVGVLGLVIRLCAHVETAAKVGLIAMVAFMVVAKLCGY